MDELVASFPPSVGMGGFNSQPVVQPTQGVSSVTATPARVPDFADYRAAPAKTLWQIAWRFYGKGIYYPVLLEDNPGLAVHGPLDVRTLRIAGQREHAQETYRRLVYYRAGRGRDYRRSAQWLPFEKNGFCGLPW